MANVIVPFPGRERAAGREPGGHADGEGAGRDLRREAHLLGVAARGGGDHRAVRSRRGAHRGHRAAVQRDLLQPGLATARRRHRPAAGQAEGHRRRAHHEPHAVDAATRRGARTNSGRSRTPSSRSSSASRARAMSTRSAAPTRRCRSRSTRSGWRATASRCPISWARCRRPTSCSTPARWSPKTGVLPLQAGAVPRLARGRRAADRRRARRPAGLPAGRRGRARGPDSRSSTSGSAPGPRPVVRGIELPARRRRSRSPSRRSPARTRST